MFDLPLAAIPWYMTLIMIVWVAIAVMLILIILVQKGRGGGLGGAFGGMGAGSLLGTKTGDVLTWVTIVFVALFLGLGVVMVKWYRPSAGLDLRETQVMTEQVPGGLTVAEEDADNADGQNKVDSGAQTDVPAIPAAPAADKDVE